jgi:hypothetical protein
MRLIPILLLLGAGCAGAQARVAELDQERRALEEQILAAVELNDQQLAAELKEMRADVVRMSETAQETAKDESEERSRGLLGLVQLGMAVVGLLGGTARGVVL